jgi:hypothetical protein
MKACTSSKARKKATVAVLPNHAVSSTSKRLPSVSQQLEDNHPEEDDEGEEGDAGEDEVHNT